MLSADVQCIMSATARVFRRQQQGSERPAVEFSIASTRMGLPDTMTQILWNQGTTSVADRLCESMHAMVVPEV